ncbi:glycoside hydrolase family 32 protein [Utexia brackfieldae]|uniref:glycoside hydrolase family 32 protein n=1 Tax=Utexia brackfieldae TaxID=3074108 RepID=UPI00370DA24E
MTHDEVCQRATQSVQTLSLSVNPRFYPLVHFAPPAGWINDPNGLIYFNQQYHLFYQHYPHSSYRGPMHWGHAVSDDLIHWQHLPIALAPGQQDDVHGVYSGSAVDNHGELTLFYTGHTVVDSNASQVVIRQVQMLATSRDGATFEKHGVIIEPPAHIEHFRDPKVWRDADSWKMVIGVSEHQTGQVWLYTSTDLRHWQFDQVLLKAKPDQGWMWECPDFFPLGDKWILVVSPMGMQSKQFAYNNKFQVGYFVGTFNNNQFIVEQDFTELDHGLDLYAPQTYSGSGDQRIMLSWFSMPETPIPEQPDHWSTCLTFPRIITLNEQNQLIQTPLPAIKQLRQTPQKLSGIVLNDERFCLPLTSDCCELSIEIDITKSDAERYGLMLTFDPQTDKGVKLYIDKQSQRLYLDRSSTAFGPHGHRSIALPDTPTLLLHLIIDKSTCEIFVNHGQATLSARIYADYTANHIALYAENGQAYFNQFCGWPLQSAWIKPFPYM